MPDKPPDIGDVLQWPTEATLTCKLHRAPNGSHALSSQAEDACTVAMLSQVIILLQQQVHALLMAGAQTVGDAKRIYAAALNEPTVYDDDTGRTVMGTESSPLPTSAPKGGWKH